MKYNRLGDADLQVSEFCLGTMTWGGQNTEREAHSQADYALGQGINFIDTAEMYPVPPRAETVCRTEHYLGTWLKRQARDGRTEFTRANIVEAVNDSLKRLQTDYLDLYQIHWPDRNVQFFGASEFTPKKDGSTVPIVDQIETMVDLIKAGKIRYYGLSNETFYCGDPRAPFDARALNQRRIQS